MKNSILILLVSGLFSMCTEAQTNSNGSQDSPNTTLKKVFPKEKWLTVQPEEVGYSSKKLSKAKDKFEETGGVSALVIVNGYIIADWGLTDQNIDCRSIRKSFISSLLGVHMEKGDIDYNMTLADAEINDANKLTDHELQTKIKYLMSSSSGIYLPAAFEEQTRRNKPERGIHKPGAYFQYNNWDFNALSTIFNKSTDRDFFEAFDEQIAKPLQMEHFDAVFNTAYIYQPALSDHMAYLFRISTKDLARYGLLYLNEGNWNGKQLVPKEWVIESTSTQIETGEEFYYNYGYLWWVSKRKNSSKRTAFLARGAQSQYMYIDPSNDLIVIFRDNPDDGVVVKKSEAYPLIGAVYGAMIR